MYFKVKKLIKIKLLTICHCERNFLGNENNKVK